MNIARRAATLADTGFARDAHHRAYRDVVIRQFGEWDGTRQDEWFDRDWSGGRFEVLLCDEVPCGYLFIEETVECIRIRELVLLPEYQGRGIGSSLLCDTMERAKQGRLPLTLDVLHENRARDLYRSLGFRECGRTETHVRMQWDEEAGSSKTRAAMNIDWSELGACGGHGSAKRVPLAIEGLFSGGLEERKKAYWEIDNHVVVQGDLYESAPYAARLIVDRIKADPGGLNGEVLDILFEIALGYAGEQAVQHGPLQGQPIQQLCLDTIAEVLPVLAAVRTSVGDRERGTIDDLFAEYEEGEK